MISENIPIKIFCCPVTRQTLKLLPYSNIQKLNKLICKGKVKYFNGHSVQNVISDALITQDRKNIYEVVNGVPILISSKGIPNLYGI